MLFACWQHHHGTIVRCLTNIHLFGNKWDRPSGVTRGNLSEWIDGIINSLMNVYFTVLAATKTMNGKDSHHMYNCRDLLLLPKIK